VTEKPRSEGMLHTTVMAMVTALEMSMGMVTALEMSMEMVIAPEK